MVLSGSQPDAQTVLLMLQACSESEWDNATDSNSDSEAVPAVPLPGGKSAFPAAWLKNAKAVEAAMQLYRLQVASETRRRQYRMDAAVDSVVGVASASISAPSAATATAGESPTTAKAQSEISSVAPIPAAPISAAELDPREVSSLMGMALPPPSRQTVHALLQLLRDSSPPDYRNAVKVVDLPRPSKLDAICLSLSLISSLNSCSVCFCICLQLNAVTSPPSVSFLCRCSGICAIGLGP